MADSTRRGFILLFTLVCTFVVLRIALYLSPNSNVDIGPYNIHHLFTGVLLLTLSALPLLLHIGNNRVQDGLLVIFAVGLAMVLDEWVYLITTDGSDSAYLTTISFWGGVSAIGLACLYTISLIWYKQRCTRETVREVD
jgi:uncharacterized membrane protein